MKVDKLNINGNILKYNKFKIDKKLSKLYSFNSCVNLDSLLINNNEDLMSSNFNKAYNYIFNGHKLNKDNLKNVYDLLMNGILSDKDLKDTSYYRTKDSYVSYNINAFGSFYLYFRNADPNLLERSMDDLFNYLDNSKDDEFIKSQILHIYIILLQPYFDGNHRIARVSSIWNMVDAGMLNYISYIKGIFLNKFNYNESIKRSRQNFNITSFLENMIDISIYEKTKDDFICNYSLTYDEDSIIRILLEGGISMDELINKARICYGYFDKCKINNTIKSLSDKNIIEINEKIKIKK